MDEHYTRSARGVRVSVFGLMVNASLAIIKLLAGQGREVKWLMYVMALVLVAYFVCVRMEVG